MQLATSCSSVYSMLIHAFASFLTTQNKQIASCRYICSRWMERMNREIRCVRWLAQSRLRSSWNYGNLVSLGKHWQCRLSESCKHVRLSFLFFFQTHLTTTLLHNPLKHSNYECLNAYECFHYYERYTVKRKVTPNLGEKNKTKVHFYAAF